jgi:hypothetical protein
MLPASSAAGGKTKLSGFTGSFGFARSISSAIGDFLLSKNGEIFHRRAGM